MGVCEGWVAGKCKESPPKILHLIGHCRGRPRMSHDNNHRMNKSYICALRPRQ